MLYNKLLDRSEKLSLIGLGYVGMPIAVAFSQKVNVIGFDINQQKISLYKKEWIQLMKLETKLYQTVP